MRVLAAITGTAALLAAPAAAASCVTVEPVLTPAIQLDPLDASGASQLAQTLTLRFHRADPGAGALRVQYQIVDEDTPVNPRAGATQGPQIAWHAQDTGREIGAARSEGYPLLRSGVVQLGDDEHTAVGSVILRLVNLREDFPAGVYREQYTVRYWCGDDPMPFEARGAVAVTVVAPNVLSATLGGASAHGEIDFLDFATTRRQLAVSVRSTGSYRISARSQNGGVMVRQGSGARDAADRIAYEVTFAGRRLALDGGAPIAMDRDGLAGRQHALEVAVEDVRDKRAGDYADTIFLTLEPAN